MTKIFNPKDWLAVPEQKEVPKKPINNKPTTVVANDIETYINALEQSGNATKLQQPQTGARRVTRTEGLGELRTRLLQFE